MAAEVFQFEDVTVDLRRVSVSRGGLPVALEPKTFEVLRVLIENRDRLVTKEELLDTVWKDTFVTPNVLTRAVAQLRKALNDDAFEARYIETVAKRGYRFIAPVTPVRQEVPAAAIPPAPPQIALEKRGRRAPLAAVFVVAIVLVCAAALAVLARRAPPSEGENAGGTLSPRRFTVGSESYSFPAISPDGRSVAYSSDRTGSMEIYTTSLTARGNEVAITSDGGQNIHAAWSPDGQWLAFHSRQKGGIWIVPAGGGVARRVVDFGSVPVWTADGERIVFSSIAGGMAAQSLLWTVNRDGTHTAPLTSLGNPRGGHSQPSVSPDGRFVAFAVAHGLLRTEVRMMPISGGESTSLGEGTLYASPRFSPDSRSVYWAGRTPEGNDALMRIAIDDAGRRTGTPETVLPFIGNFVGGLSIARNGTAVMSLYRAVANLWSVSVAPTGAQQPAVQLTFDDVRNTAPRFSPDGHVAFHQQAVGQPNTTWVMDADGQNRQALTVGLAESVWGPQWAPDGRRLFVIVVAKGGATSFAWIDTVTRQMTPIPLPVDGALSPVLSPDGREIAFHVIDTAGVLNVWRQPLAGGPRTQVTFDSEAMSYPQWSWDGKWLAVEIKRGDQTYMGVVSREGGAVEEVVTEKGQTWPFSWPANDRIVFAGERDGVWNVYSVSRATKEVRRLTDFSSVRGYVRYPAASHDGSRIIFERGEQTGSLWTVQLP